jgi:hypothetical protein
MSAASAGPTVGSSPRAGQAPFGLSPPLGHTPWWELLIVVPDVTASVARAVRTNLAGDSYVHVEAPALRADEAKVGHGIPECKRPAARGWCATIGQPKEESWLDGAFGRKNCLYPVQIRREIGRRHSPDNNLVCDMVNVDKPDRPAARNRSPRFPKRTA